jgi:aldehyde dehydrogenase family protein
MTHMTIFESRNPTTGELIASYPEHTPAEVEARLTRVWSGWKAWSATPLAQRVAFLNKLADGLQKRVDEFARLITKEMGKPLAEAQAEVKKAASGARHFAEAGPDYIAPQPGAWHPETSHLSIAWPGPRDHAVESSALAGSAIFRSCCVGRQHRAGKARRECPGLRHRTRRLSRRRKRFRSAIRCKRRLVRWRVAICASSAAGGRRGEAGRQDPRWRQAHDGAGLFLRADGADRSCAQQAHRCRGVFRPGGDVVSRAR